MITLVSFDYSFLRLLIRTDSGLRFLIALVATFHLIFVIALFQQKLWIIFFNKVKGKGEKMTFTKFSIKKTRRH
jgi:hypothetical protein